MGQERPAHLRALTGLRILAATGVFLTHIGPPAFLPEVAANFMRSGYNGVTLFFILSGFVLTWNYSERILPIRRTSLWSFTVARFARIYPLYLFALLVVIFPALLAGKWEPLMGLHALALQTWGGDLGTAYSYNGPGWSIGVELFLYACFPLLILVFVKAFRSPKVLLIIGAAIVAAAFLIAWWFVATGRADLPWADPESAHRWLYRNPAFRLGDFALGIIVAALVRSHRPPVAAAVTAQIVGAVGIITIMCFPPLLYTAWSWDSAYMAPTALLIWGLASAPNNGLARPLSTKPMVLMGEASFAFYLLHSPLIIRMGVPAGSPREWVAGTVILFVLVMLVSIGAHMVIERPAQRWLRKTLTPRTGDTTKTPRRLR